MKLALNQSMRSHLEILCNRWPPWPFDIGSNFEHTVFIYFEDDFNCWLLIFVWNLRNVDDEVALTDSLAIFGIFVHLATLEHLDVNVGLINGLGNELEDWSLVREWCVLRDQNPHDIAVISVIEDLHSNISLCDILNHDISLNQTRLNSRKESGSFRYYSIEAHRLAQLLSREDIIENLLDHGNSSGATDKHDFVNLSLLDITLA